MGVNDRQPDLSHELANPAGRGPANPAINPTIHPGIEAPGDGEREIEELQHRRNRKRALHAVSLRFRGRKAWNRNARITRVNFSLDPGAQTL